VLSLGGLSGAALANELDILNEPPPGTQHVIDDAGVLNKTTRRALNDELSRLEVCSTASIRTYSSAPSRLAVGCMTSDMSAVQSER
jgi:uncharacterized membrane protein YgcG